MSIPCSLRKIDIYISLFLQRKIFLCANFRMEVFEGSHNQREEFVAFSGTTPAILSAF